MEEATKILDDVREKIRKELALLDTQAYSDTLISVQLESVRKQIGEDAKNDLIDEFDLTKLGWTKEPGLVKRHSRKGKISLT